MNIALVTASGQGQRLGSPIPKQFLPLGGGQVIDKSVDAFLELKDIDLVIVTLGKDQEQYWNRLADYKKNNKFKVVEGGLSRQESVYKGLEFVENMVKAEYQRETEAQDCPIDSKLEERHKILIHDGARPFLKQSLIEAILNGFGNDISGCIPVIDMKDSLLCLDGLAAVDRSKIKAIQTPQGFFLDDIISAFRQADADGFQGTDESSIAAKYGLKFGLVIGDESNVKLTTVDDYTKARALEVADEDESFGFEAAQGKTNDVVKKKENEVETMYRIGNGYDVHQLVEGRKLILGGVDIPFEKGLLGHSDADVLIHSLMDALIGAMSLGDIGKHFPDSDPAYKGASSMELLKHVVKMMEDNSYQLSNCDVTVICQRPKLANYIEQMRVNIAEVLKCSLDQVSIKATTTEGLGFEGEGAGISAMASACLYKIK